MLSKLGSFTLSIQNRAGLGASESTRGCNGILVSTNLRISNLGYEDYLPYMAESDSFDSYGKMINFNISIKKTKDKGRG